MTDSKVWMKEEPAACLGMPVFRFPAS